MAFSYLKVQVVVFYFCDRASFLDMVSGIDHNFGITRVKSQETVSVIDDNGFAEPGQIVVRKNNFSAAAGENQRVILRLDIESFIYHIIEYLAESCKYFSFNRPDKIFICDRHPRKRGLFFERARDHDQLAGLQICRIPYLVYFYYLLKRDAVHA